MTCKQYRNLLHEFMDNSLTPESSDELRAHLESCPNCKIIFKTYQLTIKLSHGAETCRDVSEDELHRLKTYIKKCIHPEK